MRVSAIVTGYNDVSSLRKNLGCVLECSFDEIILAVGGNDGTYDYVSSLGDPRLRVFFENERIGKMPALRRAVEHISGDLTFLICSDVSFQPETIWKALGYFDQRTGVVVPKVVPTNDRTFPTRIASAIWAVRNLHLMELERSGKSLHGGEVLIVRSSLLKDLREVVNDDAYICLRAIELGYSARYASDITVWNTVPETIIDLIRQRKRVNFGHRQLASINMRPVVMNDLNFRNLPLLFNIMWKVIAEDWKRIFHLPFVVGIEALSILMSKRDMRHDMDMIIWPLVG
ncbi:hypothetical protein IX51_11090 [uncultured archaeon]|nr:hypothetical protein IX51_11090 [uncultured archaeon]